MHSHRQTEMHGCRQHVRQISSQRDLLHFARHWLDEVHKLYKQNQLPTWFRFPRGHDEAYISKASSFTVSVTAQSCMHTHTALHRYYTVQIVQVFRIGSVLKCMKLYSSYLSRWASCYSQSGALGLFCTAFDGEKSSGTLANERYCSLTLSALSKVFTTYLLM